VILAPGVTVDDIQKLITINPGPGFNRYFVENNGFSFSLGGFNRVDVANGPFVTLQFDYRF